MRYTFKKEERLCSKKLIEKLFTSGESFLTYPFKIVFLKCTDCEHPASVLISVSTRKIGKAVQRNLIKRRIREAYRHLKPNLYNQLNNRNIRLYMGIIFISDKPEPYSIISSKLEKAINKLIISL